MNYYETFTKPEGPHIKSLEATFPAKLSPQVLITYYSSYPIIKMHKSSLSIVWTTQGLTINNSVLFYGCKFYLNVWNVRYIYGRFGIVSTEYKLYVEEIIAVVIYRLCALRYPWQYGVAACAMFRTVALLWGNFSSSVCTNTGIFHGFFLSKSQMFLVSKTVESNSFITTKWHQSNCLFSKSSIVYEILLKFLIMMPIKKLRNENDNIAP